MTRFIFPSLLILVAIALFMFFTNPIYKDIGDLKQKQAAYEQALANSKELQKVRDQLVAKYNSFSAQDLENLRKLLPDNVDNIRLILEIDHIASMHGMTLSNVRYNATNTKKNSDGTTSGGVALGAQDKDYGVFALQFSTQSSYDDFVSFLKDLQQSLRLVDVQALSFSSTDSVDPTKNLYKYDLTIQTYWLKN